jgi:2'-5' RNA ligase
MRDARWPALGGLLLLIFLARRASARRLVPVARAPPVACTASAGDPPPAATDAAVATAPKTPPLHLEKVHHSSVALIPPDWCWGPIQVARLDLRDKGLYRWPPHINLLYPFAPPGIQMEMALAALAPAAAVIAPFELRLDALGTFGGRSRGVLWAAPSDPAQLSALVALQAALQAAAPVFDDQQRVGGGGFVPHMTLAHFGSLDEAEAARAQLQPMWEAPCFNVGAPAVLHLIWRDGGGGQFKRAASLEVRGGTEAGDGMGIGTSLGLEPAPSAPPSLLDPPASFPLMPEEEADWVRDARRAGKKKTWGRPAGRRTRSPRRSAEERAAIAARTPEDIERIRAERAVKKVAAQRGAGVEAQQWG